MWEDAVFAAFQGRWEGWEACFWLSRLSTGRHFHSSFRLGRFLSFLPFGKRPPEPIRFGAGLQNVSAIRDSVQQRLAEARIRNHLGPFGERQVRCYNHRRPLSAFGDHLEEKLRTCKGAVCEGIRELIHRLETASEKPMLGLLTGNIRRGAELKLQHYQLWHHFKTGAFADDHEDRNCIADAARKRGSEAFGRSLIGDEIVVIGDTPHDIRCGQSIGAKVLAVGTGEFGRAKLLECNPTWAVDHVGQIEVRTLLGRDR